jgi:hypothetical protein
MSLKYALFVLWRNISFANFLELDFLVLLCVSFLITTHYRKAVLGFNLIVTAWKDPYRYIKKFLLLLQRGRALYYDTIYMSLSMEKSFKCRIFFPSVEERICSRNVKSAIIFLCVLNIKFHPGYSCTPIRVTENPNKVVPLVSHD